MREIKVLLIDNESGQVTICKNLLGDMAATLVHVTIGDDAIHVLSEGSYALILMRMQPDDIDDAFRVAQLIKQTASCSTIPMIFISSSHARQSDIERGYNLGIVDYLSDDIDETSLKSKIQFFVNLYKEKQIEKRNDFLTTNAATQWSAYDPLTNLMNRYQFEKYLQRCIASYDSHTNRKFAIIYLDLDDFKTINENYSYKIGDSFLKHIADSLVEDVNQEDCVARLGGDQFVVLLREINHFTDAGRVAMAFQEKINEPFEIDGHLLSSSISAGIVCYPSGGNTVDDLIRHADIAMRRAKALGKNQTCCFTDELQREHMERVSIEKSVRDAIAQNHFHLVYQPIYDLTNNEIVGAEALCRLNSTGHDEVSPERFISIAEETNLISDLGNMVLDLVTDDIAELSNKSVKKIWFSINVSMKQFCNNQFSDHMTQVFTEKNIPYDQIEVELTESVLVSDLIRVEESIQKLNDLGIRISIDDFGTGYSSLRRLREMPISTIKIDKLFMQEMEDVSKKDNMIITILGLARNLKLNCIAEGIETQQQRQFLIENGCQYGQGFLMSKPVRFDTLIKMLRSA